MHGATNASIIAATIVVVIVIIIATWIMTTEVEKDIDRSCNKGSMKGRMTAVYGKSFMTPPHGSHQTAALERASVGAGPRLPQQVAGASFSHL